MKKIVAVALAAAAASGAAAITFATGAHAAPAGAHVTAAAPSKWVAPTPDKNGLP